NIRFGLDSVIGLIPGVGDLTGAALSGYIVLTAARMGVPSAVLGRMLLNLGLDTLVGTVPLLGDLFDVGFRANTRNAALLDRYLERPLEARRSSKLAIWAALAGVALLALVGVGLTIMVVRGLNWLAAR
ncbi:MAG TPA: DUF4112 domain-containing protein, partial [Gemmatimonadaceae bacterium]|nr:DUF4112 domain-containing protein [Gemmatimonadaceae bacterium]